MFLLKVDEQIQLKLVHPAFAPRYVKLAKDNYDDLAKWLVWPPLCKTQQDFEGFITREQQEFSEEKSITCGMFYQDALVGNVSYHNMNKQLKKVEIGYWLAKPYQGRGIVTRVCQKLIDYAFGELNFDKVEIHAVKENIASRAVCERLGMSLEGVITNADFINGRIVDHAIYGLHQKG